MIKKIAPFIPLGVMAATLLYTVYVWKTVGIVMYYQHVLAMILTLVNIVCYFVTSSKNARLVTLGIIIFGCFNAIYFRPGFKTAYFGIGRLEIPFQPYSYLVLLIFIICNYGVIAKFRK